MVISGVFKEGHGGRAPPAQNFFISMQFSGKIGQINNRLTPPSKAGGILWEILDPPLVILISNLMHDKKNGIYTSGTSKAPGKN